MKKHLSLFKSLLLSSVVVLLLQSCLPNGVPLPVGAETGTFEIISPPTSSVIIPGSSWPTTWTFNGDYIVDIFKDSDNSLVISRLVNFSAEGPGSQDPNRFKFKLTPNRYYYKIKNVFPIVFPLVYPANTYFRINSGAPNETESDRFDIVAGQTIEEWGPYLSFD